MSTAIWLPMPAIEPSAERTRKTYSSLSTPSATTCSYCKTATTTSWRAKTRTPRWRHPMLHNLVLASPEPALPPLIAGAGERAAWRFLEFFTVNIRNKNTRAAYTRAAGAFLHWCEERGMHQLENVHPVHVAAYIEELQGTVAAPTVKQHLACIRMLFDWLV